MLSLIPRPVAPSTHVSSCRPDVPTPLRYNTICWTSVFWLACIERARMETLVSMVCVSASFHVPSQHTTRRFIETLPLRRLLSRCLCQQLSYCEPTGRDTDMQRSAVATLAMNGRNHCHDLE